MSNVIPFPGQAQPEPQPDEVEQDTPATFEDWVYAEVPDLQDRVSRLTDIALDEGEQAFRAEVTAIVQHLQAWVQ